MNICLPLAGSYLKNSIQMIATERLPEQGWTSAWKTRGGHVSVPKLPSHLTVLILTEILRKHGFPAKWFLVACTFNEELCEFNRLGVCTHLPERRSAGCT